jgi:hypothetical protein
MYCHHLQKSRVNPTFTLACAAVNNCYVPIGNMRFNFEADLLKISKVLFGGGFGTIHFCAAHLTFIWCRVFGPVVGTVTAKAIAPAHPDARRAVLGNTGEADRPRATVRAAPPKRSRPVDPWQAV